MVLDTGGLLTPHGVARFAATEDPAALAELIDQLGYRALALGVKELGAPRTSIIDVIRLLRWRGIPTLATNLRCEDEAIPFCDLLVDASDGPSIHQVGARSMAVLSFLPENATQQIAPDLAGGITIMPIVESMPASVRRAREQGASLVVAVASMSPSEALHLAEELPIDARPDLLLLADASDLLFARPATVVPALASPPRGDAVEIVLREGLLRVGYEMVAQPLGGAGVDVGAPVREFTRRVGPAYCAAWGRTLEGGTLTRDLDARGLADVAMRAVLNKTEADVSVINLGAIDRHWRPSREDALTASDLYIGLEYDEPLLMADVSAAWITELARRLEPHELVAAGLSWDGSTARVLGRPLSSRASYRVVTLRYLATGGDGALPPLPPNASWTPVEIGTLRSVVLEQLRSRSERDPREGQILRAIAPEWIVTADSNGLFSGSSIENRAMYDSAPLSRVSTVTLGIEVNLRADATAPDWSWENSGVLRYRAQWMPSTTPGTAGAFAEAVDQIQVRSLGAWRGLRSRPSEWYVPDPYLEVFLESELTPDGRDWHWLLLRPTVGARFPLSTELELKLSTGVQGQVLQPNGEAEFGIGSVITLRPWNLAKIEDRRVTLEGLVDFFLVDLFDQNRWQLRGNLDAVFELTGPLALTLGVRLYLQQERAREVGVALDATAGLRLGWLGRTVGP